MTKYYKKANRNFPTADLKECFIPKKTTKITWNLYSIPCYAPVITRTAKPDVWISELRRLNVALPRHIKDVLYDHHLFFTSVVNYITAENKMFALKSLTRVAVTFIVVASHLMVELSISVQRLWTLAIRIQIHEIFHKTRLTNCNPAAICCVINKNCQEKIGFQNSSLWTYCTAVYRHSNGLCIYLLQYKNYVLSVILLVVVVDGQSSQIIRSLPPHSLERTQYEIHQRNFKF